MITNGTVISIQEKFSDEDDWVNYGKKLAQTERGVGWLIGKWWNDGVKGGYRVARVKECGFKYGYCRNCGSVVDRVSQRYDSLTFHHHAQVVDLSPPQQKKWLTLAVERTASQEGVVGITSRGYAVPWRDIHAAHLIRVDDVAQFRNLRGRKEKEFSPSQKGAMAVAIVKEVFLRKGLQDVEDIADRQQQIGGGDLIVRRHIIIQVKMDWRCGPAPKGTGNVYLQTAERNPLKRY